MTEPRPTTAPPPRNRPSGFHEGERAVQRLLGVRHDAVRLEGMLGPGTIGAGTAGFLAERTFVAIAGRDPRGLLWTSPIVGPPGFVEVRTPTLIDVHAVPADGDPLHGLRAGTALGLIAMDYTRRRRFRVNGTLIEAAPDRLRIGIEEAFGNCPQHIPRLTVLPDLRPHDAVADVRSGRVGTDLPPIDRRIVERSVSFYLGTAHAVRGADVSHRGGPAGFVRVDASGLSWPDFPGNNLFNSLGNLHVDPEAALLFPDFATGTALLLRGTARLCLDPADPGARRIAFTSEHRARRRLGARLGGT